MEFWEVPVGLNTEEAFQLKNLKHTKYSLTRKEQNLLRKNGNIYYQLMDGTISPVTKKQEHFVEMCKGLVEPQGKWERIWKSYLTTVEEEKRLDAIHRENLRQSPDVQKYLDHLWLAGAPHSDGDVTNDHGAPPRDHSRECRACRGSGMKFDGASCDRCNGRGWIA